MTLSLFYGLMQREWRLSWRQLSDSLNPLLFFVMVIVLFTLSVEPQPKLLHTIGPGVIWVAALLAMLLSQAQLFTNDYQQGVCAQWCVEPHGLIWRVLAKILAQWLMLCGPLILLTPLLASGLQLPWVETRILMLSLLLGTPTLFLLGAAANALTLGLRGGGVLLAVLILPLSVPVLIFGAGSVLSVVQGQSVVGLLSMLGALLVLALTVLPFVVAAGVRLSTCGG